MYTPTPCFCLMWLILINFDRHSLDAQGAYLGLVAIADCFALCLEFLKTVNV